MNRKTLFANEIVHRNFTKFCAYQHDILCISESWLPVDAPNSALFVQGFEILRFDISISEMRKTRHTWHFTPIFKTRNKADVKYDCPICLLCCFSKVFLRIIFDALYKTVKDYLLASKDLEKKGSATLQLIIFMDRLYELDNTESLEQLYVLYIDFAKAFETVPHDILI